jgi:hypothetical protein
MPSSEQSKRVRYVGNSPRVAVPLADGSQVFCDRDKSVEVPTSVATALLKQDVWETGRGVKAEEAPTEPDPETSKAGK